MLRELNGTRNNRPLLRDMFGYINVYNSDYITFLVRIQQSLRVSVATLNSMNVALGLS